MNQSRDELTTEQVKKLSGSYQLLQKLEDKRVKNAIQRKLFKEEIKAKETLEEKRARRLKEKQEKELRRRERMGWDTEYQNYTNQDNPFGDANLTSSFVWCKKMEKYGVQNMGSNTLEAIHRQKQIENKLELEKVKKRRKEREFERQSRDEDILILQRSREAAQYEELEKQEDNFHLEQARLRSFIRIRDGRAKPIDLLAQYVSNSNLEDTIEMQMHEPYQFVNGLNIQDLEDLLADIKVYVKLERGNNNDFWSDMTVIVEDELQKQTRDAEKSKIRRTDIHNSVSNDIGNILKGKTLLQLEELMKKVENKIIKHNSGIDISYWESLLSQLKAHMAKARLREKHQINLKQKLAILKKTSLITQNSKPISSQNVENEIGLKTNNPIFTCSIKLYNDGSYSPLYVSLEDLTNDIEIISPDEAENDIETLRKLLIEKNYDESLSQVEFKMQQEVSKGMHNDETEFAVEADLEAQVYLWSDKYRPRKPRYFNRVHTGFEWNKYNQTHYDMDNPPPKIVQGYKFNIFYPDLINKECTPQYYLSQCSDNKDFAILRFHTGPPYEDIAFKIVNREWEFSYKRGFRCQFHNNIFQLWFHFKRYRYRR